MFLKGTCFPSAGGGFSREILRRPKGLLRMTCLSSERHLCLWKVGSGVILNLVKNLFILGITALMLLLFGAYSYYLFINL